MLYLSRFDFTLKHILGVKMGKTDRLSRRLDLKVELRIIIKIKNWSKKNRYKE